VHQLAAAAQEDSIFCLWISPGLAVLLLACLGMWARDRRRWQKALLAERWARRQNTNGRMTRNSP
jgi:cytochrome c-type biogenesis protein CcmH/NrfF